ncbi:MAG: hypothetical protein BMS9Abin18_1220 [Zetaproteobacteria bacterium]|nr:MAG: hypothetical protein BMS9Abin18_1220 [Zetaproteobacteria bacterium]
MVNEADIALHYKLMKLINERPEISQRELAAEMGLSLGKVNYCLKAFVSKGLVKVNNFRRSDNKLAYAYLLTPKGIEEKARVTVRFFRRVEAEYETLKQEVAHLDRQQNSPPDAGGIPPEIVEKICASLPDVMAVYLFGSAASGKMHPESDIDMAVLADSPIDPEHLWKLAQDIAVMLGVEVVLIDLRQASTVMRMQVVEGGKRLSCRDQAACDAFEDFAFSDFARLNEERAGILEDVERRGVVYGK